MKNLLIVLGLMLSVSMLGQSKVDAVSEVRATGNLFTVMDYLYADNREVAEEAVTIKTQQNSISFEDDNGDWYVLTYAPELDYEMSNSRSPSLGLKSAVYRKFQGERNMFVYKITGYDKYKRVTDTLYTSYRGQNDYSEVFTYTIHKGGDLATSYVWRVDTDTWMLITAVHWEDGNNHVHKYNDIIFLKKTNEVDDTFTHTHFSTKGLVDDTALPQLRIDSHTKDDNVVTLKMKDGQKLKFTFLENGKIHYQGQTPLDKI